MFNIILDDSHQKLAGKKLDFRCFFMGKIGLAMAACLSYAVNKSIVWAIVHGLLSWFYVFYYLFSVKGYLIN